MNREKTIKLLEKSLRANGHIIGIAAGSGSSAKYAVDGGADLILALNAGRFRLMGRSSIAGLMPYANCNEMVMDYGTKEILPIVRDNPVVFGMCATDPMIQCDTYIDYVIQQGFSGMNNYPTISVIDGKFRESLEESGITFDKEVNIIRCAREKGLFTVAFVYQPDQAAKMLEAGADAICVNFGFTRGGTLGAKYVLSLEASAKQANEIFHVCDQWDSRVFKLVYGGYINTPADVKYMYDNTSTNGYIGGSTFERTPPEKAIIGITREFIAMGESKQSALLTHMLEGVLNHYGYVDFVKEYVQTNYMHGIYLTDLADVVHVSHSYLSRLFHREVGCTFTNYVTRFRINKAVEMMSHYNMSLMQIASSVGFQDYAHFSKTFKKLKNISPNEFRNSLREIEVK